MYVSFTSIRCRKKYRIRDLRVGIGGFYQMKMLLFPEYQDPKEANIFVKSKLFRICKADQGPYKPGRPIQ